MCKVCLICGIQWQPIRQTSKRCPECKSSLSVEVSNLVYNSYSILYFGTMIIPLLLCIYYTFHKLVIVLVLCSFGQMLKYIEQYRKYQFIKKLKIKLPQPEHHDLVWPSETASFIRNAYRMNNTKKHHVRKSVPLPVKERVWRRDHGSKVDAICPVCYRNRISVFNFQCGHIISFKVGGSDGADNLVAICAPCNQSMGTENLHCFQQRIWS